MRVLIVVNSTKEEVVNYLTNVPNDGATLVRKVIAIIGIYGLTRKSELVDVTIKDIHFQPDCILVDIRRKNQKGQQCSSTIAITDNLSRSIISKYYSNFTTEVNSPPYC